MTQRYERRLMQSRSIHRRPKGRGTKQLISLKQKETLEEASQKFEGAK